MQNKSQQQPTPRRIYKLGSRKGRNILEHGKIPSDFARFHASSRIHSSALDPRIEVVAPIQARSIVRKEPERSINPSFREKSTGPDGSQWGDEEFDMIEILENHRQQQHEDWDEGSIRGRDAGPVQVARPRRPWTLHQSLREGGQLFDAEKMGTNSLGEALLSMGTKLAEFPMGDRRMMSKSRGMLRLKQIEGGLSGKALTYDLKTGTSLSRKF